MEVLINGRYVTLRDIIGALEQINDITESLETANAELEEEVERLKEKIEEMEGY